MTSVVLDHVGLPVRDVEASRRFYASVLAPLGLREVARDDAGGTGYGLPGADDLWLVPAPGRRRTPATHVALRASSRESVDAFAAAARRCGAEVRGPRTWPQYSAGYYAAFALDPDGHNLEAVHHASPAPPPAA